MAGGIVLNYTGAPGIKTAFFSEVKFAIIFGIYVMMTFGIRSTENDNL